MTNAPTNGGARSIAVDQTNASNMALDHSEVNSVDFLEWMRPAGPWVLSAIVPDGRITTLTFTQENLEQMSAWIASRDGAENLYFQVNSSGDKKLAKKASKAGIVAADWLHVDVDPKPDEAKADILARIQAFPLRPSAVVDSGGGYQAFWRIASTDELDDVEAINRWLAAELGGDHCHNIDRIMRLPGTTNVPNAKKRKAGREPCPSRVVWRDESVWDRAAFGRLADDTVGTAFAPVGTDVAEVDLAEIHDLLPPTAVKHAKAKPQGSRNEDAFAYMMACAAGDVPDEIALGFALHPDLPVSDFYYRDPSGKARLDPVALARKDLGKARGKVVSEATPTTQADFSCDKDGKPYADLDNLRIALDRLGLPLWWDEFADRTWLGGEQLTDHLERDLREVGVKKLGLKYAKASFFELLSQIAWENRRHPLREKLNGLVWDGEPRIETFLIDWAGAEDNEYVRTVTRLWFLAGARRVVEPGVKFDELMILESPQGGLKSSAMTKLAFGPEWFTDGLPMNGDSKIAIEQTQGKWICEVADMQGRTKDDNLLKAFLSRTHDRARLAYDRRAADVPRTWIPVGTTNDSYYLKDPTGNRRFWPIRIGAFSLSFDPDQLWAEAVARRDESIRMPQELWALAGEQQRRRAQNDPWEDEIARRLGEAEVVLAADVWDIVGVPMERRGQGNSAARLGAIMQKLGYDRKQIRRGGPPEWHYVRGKQERRFYPSTDALQGDMPF